MSEETLNTRFGIILLDADRLFGEMLARTLESADFSVLDIVSHPKDVDLDMLANSDKRMLICDVEDNDSDMIAFLKEAKQARPDLKVVVLARSNSPATLKACLEIDVHAYLDKNISFESFVHYLSFAALDEKVLPINLATSFISANGTSASSVKMPFKDIEANFSDRERAILAYLIQGESNKVIARHLGIADGTVKVSIKTILRKINANNRTQAAIWALQHASAESFLESASPMESKSDWAWNGDDEAEDASDDSPVEVRNFPELQFEDVSRPRL